MIIRRRHTANFTTIGNTLFADDRLALDELGLLVWLLSQRHDWEVRRPALMRRFKVGRDGLRRVLRSLMRAGWIRAQITRSAETGRVYVTYEVRDEPGPELSEEEARAALSLVSSGAGSGEAPDDGGEGDDPDTETAPECAGADPPADGAAPPVTPEPVAARRLRQSPPGPIKTLTNTDSENTESPNGVRALARAIGRWPPEHVMSRVAVEAAMMALSDEDFADCEAGIPPYLSDCEARSRKVCDLRTFVVERRWERFLALASKPRAAVFKVRSAQWYRWHEYRVATGQSIRFMEHYASQNPNGVWSEPSEWPPPMPKREQGQDASAVT